MTENKRVIRIESLQDLNRINEQGLTFTPERWDPYPENTVLLVLWTCNIREKAESLSSRIAGTRFVEEHTGTPVRLYVIELELNTQKLEKDKSGLDWKDSYAFQGPFVGNETCQVIGHIDCKIDVSSNGQDNKCILYEKAKTISEILRST